jgi:uncharacterized protein
MDLSLLSQTLSICKITDLTQVNFADLPVFLGITGEEISLVCRSERVPENTLKCDPGWRGFRIEGELDFALIGILSKISGILADHQIGIFVVSTFNTDTVLVKEENLEHAVQVLTEAGYRFVQWRGGLEEEGR